MALCGFTLNLLTIQETGYHSVTRFGFPIPGAVAALASRIDQRCADVDAGMLLGVTFRVNSLFTNLSDACASKHKH